MTAYVDYCLICIAQEKGVNISIIGIGEDWTKHRNRIKMREMAGEKGKVLMYDSFDELADSFDEILAALCRKLAFVPFAFIRL